MAVHVMAVGFDQEPPVDNNSVLQYLGFDPVTTGQPVQCELKEFKVKTQVPDVVIRIIRCQDEKMTSDDLTVVFVGAFTLENITDPTHVARRQQQFTDVLTELAYRLDIDSSVNTYEVFHVDNLTAVVIKGIATTLSRELIRSTRGYFHSVK